MRMTYATRQVFLRTGFQVTGTQSLACRSHVRTLVKMVNLKRISFNIYTPQAVEDLVLVPQPPAEIKQRKEVSNWIWNLNKFTGKKECLPKHFPIHWHWFINYKCCLSKYYNYCSTSCRSQQMFISRANRVKLVITTNYHQELQIEETKSGLLCKCCNCIIGIGNNVLTKVHTTVKYKSGNYPNYNVLSTLGTFQVHGDMLL